MVEIDGTKAESAEFVSHVHIHGLHVSVVDLVGLIVWGHGLLHLAWVQV